MHIKAAEVSRQLAKIKTIIVLNNEYEPAQFLDSLH